MKNFWDYLEEAKLYLECCYAGRTPDEEKDFIRRVVERYNLEDEFNSKANEDVPWQELAKEGVSYFVDVVKPGLHTSKVNPELKLLKLEFETKSVIKLLVDSNTLQAFM